VGTFTLKGSFPAVLFWIPSLFCLELQCYCGSSLTSSFSFSQSALELALTALLDPGSILLLPQPGFSVYQVIAESHGASVAFYRLLPDQKWECDLGHLEELLLEHGDRVRGILFNNPSNPTGSVFGNDHLQDLVRFCDRHRLPIVADEIYGDLAFGSNVFYPLAQVAAEAGGQVPVITVSGVGKQYLIPGWRVGWIFFHDK
jgi:tyrosine aminotransferase